MKQAKLQILLTMLFIAVGIAAVSTNLIIEGNSAIVSNTDDFLVYFSNASVDGVEKLSIVKTEKELVFNAELSAVGDKKNVGYDVTNASKNYDARVSISCTGGNEYLKVTNSFDEKNDLTARSTKSGTLTVELINAVSTESVYEVKCTINANAIERESINTGDVLQPLDNPYSIGYEVMIGDELFNVINVTEDSVELLANSALNEYFKQDFAVFDGGSFSNNNGWSYTPGPKEIDIENYLGYVLMAITEYSASINEIIPNTKVDLITLKQIEKLGCTIPSNYAYSADIFCESLESYPWWTEGAPFIQGWWTKSSVSNNSDKIWIVYQNSLTTHIYNKSSNTGFMYLPAVRPVITISRDAYDNVLENMFYLEINGDTYTFVNGMTWGQWVESASNTSDVEVIDGYIVINDTDYLYDGEYFVIATDSVDPNGTYVFDDSFQPI